jgi:5-methyltetrahydropteroyltriglutamate--homocysteine methyltransferase
MSNSPAIRTTTVGSYPVPDWLAAFPSEQARTDAMRVVFDLQKAAGIDLPADGELYRFDINDPDTNGMIDYFIRRFGGIRPAAGRADSAMAAQVPHLAFRRQVAGVVTGPVTEGSLNLPAACLEAAAIARAPFKFTVTSPYMLARTVLDTHYPDLPALTMAIAGVLAAQVRDLECQCLQVDEANLPGSPEHADVAAEAINTVLDAFPATKAVHLCFGNYGGQTVQKGTWSRLLGFLNALHADHIVMEIANRPENDLQTLAGVDTRIGIGVGVIDVKVNEVESPDEVARRIEHAESVLGAGRVQWVHPDCGLWMLKRSVADRKLAALCRGRDQYLGRK